MATRFLLFMSFRQKIRRGRPPGLGSDGCGGRIRTDDLRVMSPTSCRCSTPRFRLYPGLFPLPSRGEGQGEGRGRTLGASSRRRTWGRGDQVRLLVRLRVSVQPRLFLIGRPVGQPLHVFVIAGVLPRDLSVLPAQVGNLPAQVVDHIGLLGEGDAGPDQRGAAGEDDDRLAHTEGVGAHAARDAQSFAVSHAALISMTCCRGSRLYQTVTWIPPSGVASLLHPGRSSSFPLGARMPQWSRTAAEISGPRLAERPPD